jgi:hypothetical protein
MREKDDGSAVDDEGKRLVSAGIESTGVNVDPVNFAARIVSTACKTLLGRGPSSACLTVSRA